MQKHTEDSEQENKREHMGATILNFTALTGKLFSLHNKTLLGKSEKLDSYIKKNRGGVFGAETYSLGYGGLGYANKSRSHLLFKIPNADDKELIIEVKNSKEDPKKSFFSVRGDATEGETNFDTNIAKNSIKIYKRGDDENAFEKEFDSLALKEFNESVIEPMEEFYKKELVYVSTVLKEFTNSNKKNVTENIS